MARTRWPSDLGSLASCTGQADQAGSAGGCQGLGPADRSISGQPERHRPIRRSGRDPGLRPYARTRPKPPKQGRKHNPHPPCRLRILNASGSCTDADAQMSQICALRVPVNFRPSPSGGGWLPSAASGGELGPVRPRGAACALASPRVRPPSLRKVADTWLSTVRVERPSCAAILALVSPTDSSRSTSVSRRVRPAGFAAMAGRGPRRTPCSPRARSCRATTAADGRPPSSCRSARSRWRSLATGTASPGRSA